MQNAEQSTFIRSLTRIILTILLSFFIGSIIILAIGENPLTVYGVLFSGAFKGQLGIGSTLAMFTPLLLTSTAFALAAQAGAANVGVEGEVFLGGLVAAYIAGFWTNLPKPLLYILAFGGAMLVGALWALIPALLRVYLRVSEICVTILMNSVAIFLASYFVAGPMSAGATFSQSPPAVIRLTQFFRPSRLNTGIFISIFAFVLMWVLMKKTTLGFRIRMTGTNPSFTETVGLKPKQSFIIAMMISGALGALAGCIEILGVHGTYLDNFGANLGTNGMLISLIVDNQIMGVPFMAFFLAILRNGAMAMQQATNVPKSIVDMISALFIIFATMNITFNFVSKRKKKLQAATSSADLLQETDGKIQSNAESEDQAHGSK